MLTLRPLSALPREFSFAGFNFPRYIAALPKGTPAHRLPYVKQDGQLRVSRYYHAPNPNSRNGWGFYLTNTDANGMRWKWCDEAHASGIWRAGWVCNDFGDEIWGIVIYLPRGRGYLAGWSMGVGMASAIEPTIYDSEGDAAWAANEAARIAADRQHDYEEEEAARIAEEEEAEALAELGQDHTGD